MSRRYRLLACPRCEGDSLVLHARATTAGTLRRRRCVDCGLQFSTEERILGRAQELAISGHSLLAALESAGVPIDWEALVSYRPNRE